MKCAACQALVRTTVTALVRDGGMFRRRRVCKPCAATGALVVAGKTDACACGAAAVLCSGCATLRESRDRGKLVKSAARKLRAIAKAYTLQGIEGGPDEQGCARSCADGLEQAADILERGEW